MPERLLIVGAGGHGKVVADVARACGWQIAGFADEDESKRNVIVEPGGSRVIALQRDLLEVAAGNGVFPGGARYVALGIGSNVRRFDLAERLASALLPVLRHPSAIVSPSVVLGRGAVVCPGAIINADARLGSVAIVNSGAIVEHDCVLGHGVHLSPGAVLAGGVSVGDRSWIGAGATVIEGVRIGADVVIGAGAVVIRDVPDRTTAVGVPASAI